MTTMTWVRRATVLIIIAGNIAIAAEGDEDAALTPPLHQQQTTGEADVIKSAVYDADKGVIVVEIESDNHCNLKQAKLSKGRSGLSMQGPQIFELNYGLTTMIGCGKRDTVKLEVPINKKRAVGRIVLLKGDSSIVVSGVPERKKVIAHSRPIQRGQKILGKQGGVKNSQPQEPAAQSSISAGEQTGGVE